MAAEKSSGSSVSPIVGLAVLSVVVALFFVFMRGGSQEDRADDPIHVGTPSPAETASVEMASPEPLNEPLAASVSPGEEATAPPKSADARPFAPAPIEPSRSAPPMEPMPDHVAKAFSRGTAPISEERLLEMQAGRQEIPPEILEEMKSASNRPIPPDVLEAFQNPYPEISKEELEMLRQNGLNPGEQWAP